jgi:hypothetical protein
MKRLIVATLFCGVTLLNLASVPAAMASEGLELSCNWGGCPGAPVSCGGWSGWYACEGEFCEEHSCVAGIATYQLMERFRSCTLADNSSCLEFEHYADMVHCGCF